MRTIKHGATDQSTVIRIIDSTTGAPEQAVEHGDITLWYRREGGSVTSITPAARAAANSAHADGGIEHLDDGYYRVDLPDAACATGAAGVVVGGSVASMIVQGSYHPLSAFILDDGSTPADVATATMEKVIATHSGVSGSLAERLSRLPNVASGANGGLPLQGGAVPNATAGANGGLPTGNASGQVVVSGFANNAITTLSIADGAITAAKLADNAITAAKIAADAITSAKIAADALTAAKFAADVTTELQSGLATTAALAAAQAALEAAIAALNNLSQAQAQTAAENALTAFGAIQ
jgi:hypothetical protein